MREAASTGAFDLRLRPVRGMSGLSWGTPTSALHLRNPAHRAGAGSDRTRDRAGREDDAGDEPYRGAPSCFLAAAQGAVAWRAKKNIGNLGLVFASQAGCRTGQSEN